MQPVTRVTGVAAPLLRDDVNTDEITPIQIARELEPDYAELLFMRTRRRADGSLDPDFVLNRPQFRRPALLVTGRNFGCGSSRESAVWAMLAVGIRCIVAKSFADIYRENCLQNGVLPIELGEADADALASRVAAADGAVHFTADLERQRITGPGGPDIVFEIAAADRLRLLEGLDDIGLTLKHEADIAAFETRIRRERP
ncbi:MAG: 3-isopropylmalate dehydratase small subunit, partial [Xanthobacteraceae bacterium]|nr:3-isopropylmalate dehydratase small subunit [Xanthobacteraceae bacterium]